WPCYDAQVIADAVFALDDLALELPEDWHPAPELEGFGGLGAKAVSDAWRRMTRLEGDRQVLRVKPSDLVIRRAILGMDRAAMVIDGVEQLYERYANGQDRWFVRRQIWAVVGYDADGNEMTALQTV